MPPGLTAGTDAGAGDDDVDTAEGINGGFDDVLAVLDTVVVCDSLTASGLDLVDNHIGGLS